MNTHFASPERSSSEELAREIELVVNSPLIDGLMHIANGLFAVLNEHRQIVALNETFLKLMGIDDPGKTLGLRPGEYVGCIHACETQGGCGTSSYCSTCGAVLSILAGLNSEEPQENTCALTAKREGKDVDFFFQVRCCPIRVCGKKFVLFFLQDLSLQQRQAHLEEVFFHDINNELTLLLGKSELFEQKGVWDPLRFSELQNLLSRLAQDIAIQKAMKDSLSYSYKPLYANISLSKILGDLEDTFISHPRSHLNQIRVEKPEDIVITTDEHLVIRILTNMLINALEASGEEEPVRVYCTVEQNSVTFCVWNSGGIPEYIARRIFQKNFTTKNKLGHGLGTYSMKFFGEQILAGKASFSTSPQDGTTFQLTLPR